MNTHEDYLKDGKTYIRLSSPFIKGTMDDVDIIQGVTLFAYGVERLLKYVLVKINPIFILQASDFKNASACLYEDHFITEKRNDEVTKNPNNDVISFRKALLRSAHFSKTVDHWTQFLYRLCNYRDVLAHNLSSDVDKEKVTKLMSKDVCLFIYAFCNEYDLKVDDFFGEHHGNIFMTSKALEKLEELDKIMNELFNKHKKIFEKCYSDMSNDETQAQHYAQAKFITDSFIEQEAGKDDNWHGMFTCPACESEAVVNFDVDDDREGLFLNWFKCYFCGLQINDYAQLDHLRDKYDVTRIIKMQM